MTAPRLYLDEDVDPLLARALADRGYNVLTTHQAGRISAKDSDQLAFAAQEARAILIHNVAHFAGLAVEYARMGWERSGVVLSDQFPLKVLLPRALRLLQRNTAETLRNRVVWLQDYS